MIGRSSFFLLDSIIALLHQSLPELAVLMRQALRLRGTAENIQKRFKKPANFKRDPVCLVSEGVAEGPPPTLQNLLLVSHRFHRQGAAQTEQLGTAPKQKKMEA